MKRVINFLVSGLMVLLIQPVAAQSADESRMNRDIEVAENVLSTLIKQEFSKRNFFPMEVNGRYRAGYGVTFTIPTNVLMPMIWGNNGNDVYILDGGQGFSYSISTTEGDNELPVIEREKEKAAKEVAKAEAAKAKSDEAKAKKEDTRYRVMKTRDGDRDSAFAANTAKIIAASKNFLADYGDMMGQLKPDEKIIITNQGEGQDWFFRVNEKRSVVRIEASKSDLTAYRQGKITRDQLISKIKVTNTESTGKREPDLEVLSSAFNRLYSSDLSTTFFTEGNIYYERLTDYGAVMYMQVYSSNQTGEEMFRMPTVGLKDVDQATRDKKVKELYPIFENDLKENILEYGSTVRSLNNNEQLVFNVKLTKCKGCGIPSDIEVSVPASVLKDYSTGKIEKSSALNKISVKKGAGQ